MKETDYWEQFLKTGKVEDYLSYSAGKQEEGRQDEGKGENSSLCQRGKKTGQQAACFHQSLLLWRIQAV